MDCELFNISDSDADKFAADYANFPVVGDHEPVYLCEEDWKFLENGYSNTGDDLFDYNFLTDEKSHTLGQIGPPLSKNKRVFKPHVWKTRCKLQPRSRHSTVFNKNRNVCLFFSERFKRRKFKTY